MKKIPWTKIIVLTATIGLITGLVGGALTNEYLIAYLFGQLTEKQEEEFPIVKKVIEEKIYVEESSTLEAIENASGSLIMISDTKQAAIDFKPINSDLFYLGYSPQKSVKNNQSLAGSGVLLTTDGILATCNSFVQNRNSWFAIMDDGTALNAQVVYRDTLDDIALLRIQTDDEFNYFNTLSFNEKPVKTGQRVLSLGSFNKAKSGIVSFVPELTEVREYLRTFPSEFISIDYEIDSNLSCGPLVNLGGELVGLTLDFDTIEQGTSYVIPSKALNEALESFKLTLQ
ncbi:trypsin-like peptidase domain-containing protein [Patescibacteria group bacterium]